MGDAPSSPPETKLRLDVCDPNDRLLDGADTRRWTEEAGSPNRVSRSMGSARKQTDLAASPASHRSKSSNMHEVSHRTHSTGVFSTLSPKPRPGSMWQSAEKSIHITSPASPAGSTHESVISVKVGSRSMSFSQKMAAAGASPK